MRRFGRHLAITASLAFLGAGADASVTISSDATQNMTCSQGVCLPTTPDAVLNVNDLETLLASGDIEVTTTGAGVQADNIVVTSPVTWSAASTLAIDAYHAIRTETTISATGSGGISLASGHGGAITYENGNISFSDLGSNLSINGKGFRLVADIKGLAAEIESRPNGRFALANDFDAAGDGTYTSDPVETQLGGIVDGLGNTISNLSTDDQGDINAGLFNGIAAGGVLRNLNMADANVNFATDFGAILVGENSGAITGCSSTGEMNSPGDQYEYAGGLVGYNYGMIKYSFSSASVNGYITRGLVGGNQGTIHASFATGAVTSTLLAGGLVGLYGGAIFYSHATGATAATSTLLGESVAGGLTGSESGWIAESFANGSVTGGPNSLTGGLGGVDKMIDA
jgi:hypothetical protein